MKRIALISTVKSVLDTFEPELRTYVGNDVKIHNLFDDFLASDPVDRGGEFSITNRKRFFNDLETCALTGADLIVVTCSTLTPSVVLARPFFSVPIIAIDDEMCSLAIRKGRKIVVLATAQSAFQPCMDKLRSDARMMGKEIEVTGFCDSEAIAALKRGDASEHDRRVLSLSDKAKDADVIVLAQASMARCEMMVGEHTGILTISSPRLCYERIKMALASL